MEERYIVRVGSPSVVMGFGREIEDEYAPSSLYLKKTKVDIHDEKLCKARVPSFQDQFEICSGKLEGDQTPVKETQEDLLWWKQIKEEGWLESLREELDVEDLVSLAFTLVFLSTDTGSVVLLEVKITRLIIIMINLTRIQILILLQRKQRYNLTWCFSTTTQGK